jgi:hypothetical protein
LFAGATLAVATSFGATAHAGFTESTVAAIHQVSWEPSRDPPVRFRIDGVFSFLTWGDSGLVWSEPETGYLYFECPDAIQSECSSDWTLIESRVHEVGFCTAFGDMEQPHGRVRPLDEPPEDPDPYVPALGSLGGLTGAECDQHWAIEQQAFHAPIAADAGPGLDAGSGAPDVGAGPNDAGDPGGGCNVAPARRDLDGYAALLLGCLLVAGRRRRARAGAIFSACSGPETLRFGKWASLCPRGTRWTMPSRRGPG